MIIIILSNCPPSLRGDLTKWLFEINTNVFIGRVSARIRDDIWDRIVKHCIKGKVTMAYNAKNEQGFDFRVHNTEWVPIDFDGLKLMQKVNDLKLDTN